MDFSKGDFLLEYQGKLNQFSQQLYSKMINWSHKLVTLVLGRAK